MPLYTGEIGRIEGVRFIAPRPAADWARHAAYALMPYYIGILLRSKEGIYCELERKLWT